MTTEQIRVDIAGHVIGIYVFLCIVALDNLFDNGCIYTYIYIYCRYQKGCPVEIYTYIYIPITWLL